jgi:hypothetical protein
VITVAAVGAPAAENRYLKPMDYVNAVKIVMEALRISKCGLITNEMGGMASVNGLLQGAVLGLPVVDAPCNGRAHPTSLMGAMGLHKLPDYVAIQSAFGGHLTRGTRVELLVRGDIPPVFRARARGFSPGGRHCGSSQKSLSRLGICQNMQLSERCNRLFH